MADGIILIDKPVGVSSFKALGLIKKLVNKKTGHAGSLDNFASGLLVALCGSYTKKFDDFMSFDKDYVALIEFGKETDSLDIEGKVIKESDKIPSLEEIERSLRENFTGKIRQKPPIFSALHINGKRAYELAREGKEVEIKEREVFVYKAEMLSYKKPFLELFLTVSKGCYIRSIARDLAVSVGSFGYLTSLRRTRIGLFDVKDAIDPFSEEEIKNYKLIT